jgi:hypothetical protein
VTATSARRLPLPALPAVRTQVVVLTVTLLALVVYVVVRVLYGAHAASFVAVVHATGVFALAFTVIYPRRWWKFYFRLPARLEYRKAGTRDWTTAADLHRYGVTPEHVRAIRDTHDIRTAQMLAFDLHEAAHPDGPFAVEVVLRSAREDLHRIGLLLDLAPDERADALGFLDIDGLNLTDAHVLCRARLPLSLARRAVEHATSTPRTAVLNLGKVWSHPDIAPALHCDRDTDAGREMLTDRLHEWIDASPVIGLAGGGAITRSVEVITSYGTVPLAGWWHAAGYGPDEAAKVAAEQEWSLGQLRALAALRLGPPVT